MRRVRELLIRLYPARWRARYGDEFEALLEDSPASVASVFDLLKGATKMRIAVPSFPTLALSVIGILAGLGVSFLLTPRYVSTAVLAFRADSGPSAPDLLLACQTEVLSRTSRSFMMIDRFDLYRNERKDIRREDIVDKMRIRDIRITPLERANVTSKSFQPFEIQFSYSDRRKAQQVVQTLVERFADTTAYLARAAFLKKQQPPDQIAAMDARIAVLEQRLGIAHTPAVRSDELPSDVRGNYLEVIDAPSFPVTPVFPNRAVLMFSGLFSGFAASIVIALARRRPPPMPFPAQVA